MSNTLSKATEQIMKDNPDLDEERARVLSYANESDGVDGEAVRKAISSTSGPFSDSERNKLVKSGGFEKVSFGATVQSSPVVFKTDNDFVIWGAASVEVVDKEGDKIHAKALSKALPQLLKRARLSLDHSDQLVGRILERFDTEEEVEIEMDGKTYTRKDFPTEVLELDGMEPALYVAGEIFDDTRQAKETRERIESGELDSYSISGEALVTRKKIQNDGTSYNDIVDLDLSAVTICEDGMNQKAEFAHIKDSGKKTASATAAKSVDESNTGIGGGPSVSAVASIAKQALTKSMTEEPQESDEPEGDFSMKTLQNEFKSILDDKLPDGQLATKDDLPSDDLLTREDVEGIVDEKMAASEKDDSEDDEEEYPEEDDKEEKDDDFPFDDDDDEEEEDEEEESVPEDEVAEKDESSLAEELSEYYPDLDAGEILDLLGQVDSAEEKEEPVPEEEVPVPEEEEEEYEEEKAGYSDEDLEERLPADVWEVVREYLDAGGDDGMPPEEQDMKAEKSADIDAAVERVLSGKGLSKTGGANTPSGNTEKSYDEETGNSHGDSPALSHFYAE